MDFVVGMYVQCVSASAQSVAIYCYFVIASLLLMQYFLAIHNPVYIRYDES